MLIGTVTYYTTSGHQLADMSANVACPRRAPEGQLARWECTNGPREVVYLDEHGESERAGDVVRAHAERRDRAAAKAGDAPAIRTSADDVADLVRAAAERR